MKCKVTVTRSKEWVRERRLADGYNVPETIERDVEVSQLSEAARRVLLEAGNGGYPSLFQGYYHVTAHKFTTGCTLGRKEILVDAEEPALLEIDRAIVLAGERLAQDREEYRLLVEASEREKQQKKAEAEAKAVALAQARDLLAAELAQGKKWQEERDTLASFLSEVPDDALRGTLKALAHSEEAINALRNKVEDASPFVIFSED